MPSLVVGVLFASLCQCQVVAQVCTLDDANVHIAVPDELSLLQKVADLTKRLRPVPQTPAQMPYAPMQMPYTPLQPHQTSDHEPDQAPDTITEAHDWKRLQRADIDRLKFVFILLNDHNDLNPMEKPDMTTCFGRLDLALAQSTLASPMMPVMLSTDGKELRRRLVDAMERTIHAENVRMDGLNRESDDLNTMFAKHLGDFSGRDQAFAKLAQISADSDKARNYLRVLEGSLTRLRQL